MKFGYKDTEAALNAYTGTLNGLKLGQSFFAKLNIEYSRLTIEVFKCFFKTNSLERKYDFLIDLQMFIDDMIRKYGTTSPYGYSPRSPYEKKKGIIFSKIKSKKSSIKRLDVNDLEMRL